MAQLSTLVHGNVPLDRPDRRVYVVLLTNRVHPVPGDAAIIEHVRRDVHDAVIDGLSAWKTTG